MNYQTRLILSVFFWVASTAVVFAEQVVLTPVMDAVLYEDDGGNLANGAGNYLFFGRVASTGGEKLRRSLVKFDVSSIPADAQINSVTVSFEINNLPAFDPLGGLAELHRVTSSWNEGPTIAGGQEGTGGTAVAGDATWLHRVFPGSSWSSPGGDYISTPSGSAGYGTSLEFLDFDSTTGLRADVAAWVSNPGNNFGWILLGNEDAGATARRVYARESEGQNVPTLIVDYTVPSPTENLALTSIATGLTRPAAIANANDGTGRIFIVEQAGLVRIFDTNTQTLLPTPYLDISGLVDGTNNEQGLLGLAFHPEFSSNRKFYVYYTRDPAESVLDRSVLAMYQQDENNANDADESSAVVLMEFEQNAGNHNGGDLHFGADGYLYIASGDGGGANDQYNNAQNINTLKGKILRIDVDGSPPGGGELCGLNPQYGIPPGNAFPGAGNGCDEILHMGLRNPWKFSFDAFTGDMYIGDVGQGAREEVNFAIAGSGSLNFGWPCREGSIPGPNPGGNCPNPVDPIFDYVSTGECSVTGGYVYRGASTAMTGYYVYADYCSHRVWLAKKNNSGIWVSLEWTAAAGPLEYPTAFGQDEKCELYIVDRGTIGGNAGTGKLYRIDDDEIVHRTGFERLRCQ